MRRPEHDRRFGDKLTRLVALTSGAAVILVSGMLFVAGYADFRRETLISANSQAQVVALNSGAPMAFGDRHAAVEALAILRASPDVASATLFDADGAVFAQFRRTPDPGPAFPPGRTGIREREGWLVVHLPVADRKQILGGAQLVYDQSRLRRRIIMGLGVTLAATFGAMVTAFLIGRRISRSLVKPIAELANTANQVSRTRNYALRARKISADEVGSLTDAFNGMLAQIEQQERALTAAQGEREALLDAERSARADAEHASRIKDDFVATLSHELRTPLTPILGWVAILKRKQLADPHAREGLEVIERNARAQTQIINDLLDMSRIVSGKIRLEVENVNLRDVVDAGAATVRTAADAREIRLEIRADAAVTMVRGDPGRLQQIVWNLLTNAIKFTPQKGQVIITLQRLPAHVELSVTDTGQGIDPGFLPHVFERFRQADSSTTRQVGGLGLGLAIVKQLVDLHGGAVSAHSAGLGQGATFTVRFPVAATPVNEGSVVLRTDPDRRERADIATASLARLRVLVVDDDIDSRTLVATVLEGRGAEVVRVGSAAEALTAVRQWRPELMISDIGMPVMDGYELMRLIRTLPSDEGGKTPAIALTAFARSEDRSRALLAGYQLHLAKPIEAAELVAAAASLTGIRSRPEERPQAG
ncbi:MAG: ATP-binding protein [Panacagrimonas sp.]